jgi:hypothetical protein
MRPSFIRLRALPFAALVALSLPSCGRESRSPGTIGNHDARADHAGGTLAIGHPAPPGVDSARARSTVIAAPQSAALPAPDASPTPVAPGADGAPAASSPGADQAFQPPVLRQKCALVTPPGRHGGVIELELRVNEEGRVDEFRLVGGDRDSLLLGATVECLKVLRFYPARRGGQPVSAWSRQRFTFDSR